MAEQHEDTGHLQELMRQAQECEEKFLMKEDFYRSINRWAAAIIVMIAGAVATIVTCNNSVTANLTESRSDIGHMAIDQDKTEARIDKMEDAIVEQGKSLETLKTSTTELGKKIERLEWKADKSDQKLDRIVEAVTKD